MLEIIYLHEYSLEYSLRKVMETEGMSPPLKLLGFGSGGGGGGLPSLLPTPGN